MTVLLPRPVLNFYKEYVLTLVVVSCLSLKPQGSQKWNKVVCCKWRTLYRIVIPTKIWQAELDAEDKSQQEESEKNWPGNVFLWPACQRPEQNIA